MNNELPRVIVVSQKDGWLGTEYYIDGKKVDKVKRVDFSVGVDELPTFVFETIGIPDIDMYGQVLFSFTPKTIEEAKKILEHESRNHKIELKISEYEEAICKRCEHNCGDDFYCSSQCGSKRGWNGYERIEYEEEDTSC